MSKSEKIAKDLLPLALEKLKAVKQKETDEVSALAAVRTLRRQIERLLRQDYSYEEISQLLAGVEIIISGERLRSLHLQVKRQSRKKNKKIINSQDAESHTNSAEPNPLINNKHPLEKGGNKKPSLLPDSEKAATKKNSSLSQESVENTKDKNHNFQPKLVEDDDL